MLKTTNQIAQYYQMHPETVRKLVRHKGLPVVTGGGVRGREYRFDADAVSRYFANRRRK